MCFQKLGQRGRGDRAQRASASGVMAGSPGLPAARGWLVAAFALGQILASAAQVTLAWDANTEPDIANYRVYWGTASRAYTNSINAGNTTTATVSNLLSGIEYYFAVTALDTAGLESDYSNEVNNQVSQTIGFGTLPSLRFGDSATIAPVASSGLPVVLTLLSGPATLVGNQITATGVGAAVLQASQAGNAVYASVSTNVTLTIAPAPQSFTWPALPDRTFGDPAFGVLVTANSGLPVTLSVTNSKALVSGTTVTLTGAGLVTLVASQAGNSNYLAGLDSRTFNVAKASQTINFPNVADRAFTPTPFLPAGTASSGLPVQFQVVSGPASITTNGLVQLTGVGTVLVQAAQPGNSDWNAAVPVADSFVVSLVSQTIGFGTLPSLRFGDSATIAPVASSGLPVVLTLLSGPAALAGNQITATGAGAAVLQASQAGNAVYASVSTNVTLTIAPAPQSFTWPALPDRTFGDPAFGVLVTANSGLPVTLAVTNSDAVVSGNNVTLTGAGLVTLVASQAGNSNCLPGLDSRTFNVAKASQTINFPNVADRAFTPTPFLPAGTASSGLPVQFQIVSGPASITTNGLVQLTGVGTVVVRATQPGNSDWNAAVPIADSFAVSQANFTTIQPGALTDFSASGPFGYLATPPGTGATVTVVNACTLANTNMSCGTLIISTNGSLTVSGAVTITADLVTQGAASSVLLAAVNPTALTLNGDYDAYNTGGVSAMTTTGASTHGRSITINGQVTCHSRCAAIKANSAFLLAITVNNPGGIAVEVISSDPAASGGVGVDDSCVYETAVPGTVTINGDVVNMFGGPGIAAPMAMSAVYAHYSVASTVDTINGNVLCHGTGWALKCEGSVVTVNGTNHVLDNAANPAISNGADLFDVVFPGVLTVYGNCTGSHSDVLLYGRAGGIMTVYGDVLYEKSGTTLNNVIRTLGTGKVTVYGNVTGTSVSTYGLAPILQTGQGSITLQGDCMGCSYNGALGSTLTTYGTFAIASPGDFVNNGTWLKLLRTSFTTLQAGSLTDFSAAGPFGYLATPPGPGATVTLLHACTLAGTNVTYSTLTIGANGTLTVSGVVTITANLVTQGSASSVLLAAVNPTTLTLNGDYDAYNTGGVSAMTTTGASTHGRSITVNGQVTCHANCAAIRANAPYLDAITVNNPGDIAVEVLSSNPGASGGIGVDDSSVLGQGVPGTVTINGDLVNMFGGTNIAEPMAMMALHANGYTPGTVDTINGNLLCHGTGWALKCEGSVVTVNGTNHVADNAANLAYKAGANLLDVAAPGILTVYGNATCQNSDAGLLCRSGTLNFYGNLVYTPTGTGQPVAVWVAAGTCTVSGNISAAPGYEYRAPIWLLPAKTGDANGVLNVHGVLEGMSLYVNDSYVLSVVAPAN